MSDNDKLIPRKMFDGPKLDTLRLCSTRAGDAREHQEPRPTEDCRAESRAGEPTREDPVRRGVLSGTAKTQGSPLCNRTALG
jgi:hypothetical protein